MDSIAPKPYAELIDRSVRNVAQVLGKVDEPGWAAASPCTGWTARQVGNHLAGSLTVLLRIAGGERLAPAELDPQRLADTDRLGADPAAVLLELADRALVTFVRADILQRHFDQPVPDTTGELLANLALLESLVHGWDIATAAGVAYQPDDDVVNTVRAFATSVGDGLREQGLFGPAVPTPADAEPFRAMLGHLGRRAG